MSSDFDYSSLEAALVGFRGNGATNPRALDAIEALTGMGLPADFRAFLQRWNGGGGFVGGRPLVIWSAESLLALNTAYKSNEYIPGMLIIGSDLSGEAICFDRRGLAATVVQVPFVGMSPALATKLAPTFIEYLQSVASEQAPSTRAFADRELFDIQPVILGGDPVDPTNKTSVDRDQHIALVAWWNDRIRGIP